MRRIFAVDKLLLFCALLMAGLGVVFIYSASYPKALAQTDSAFGFVFAAHQLVYLLISIVLMLICMSVRIAALPRFYSWIIGFAALMLTATLIISRAKHGHQSYFEIGPVQFMPSEFAKIALVIAMATFLSQRPWTLRSWRGMCTGPYLFLGITTLMIMAEQDLGTMLVMVVAISTILLIAGARTRFIVLPLLAIMFLGGLLVVSGHAPERVSARIKAWMNVEDVSNAASYHPRNSLIAVGSGGLLGRGLGNSRQKWFYMPASQNDYIFAIICEEMGLVGAGVLVLLFMFIIYLGFTIAHRAPDDFSALIAAGCTVMLATPALINMAMVLNCLPSTGINLPFISYGGSSIASSLMLVGLILNVSSLQNKQKRAQPTAATPQATG